MKINTKAQRADVLDPMAERVIQLISQYPRMEEGDPVELRATLKARGNPLAPPTCELDGIEDQTIPSSGGSMRIRFYKP